MKKLMFGVMGMAAMAVAFAPAVSAKPTTVKGELIDTTCGKDGKTGKSGADHASCATSCAKRGEPVAVYTKDGGIYVVTGEVTKGADGKMTIAAEKITVAK